MLQQYLPFTVLKPVYTNSLAPTKCVMVATVLTVHGIETVRSMFRSKVQCVATVLTVHGIETQH